MAGGTFVIDTYTHGRWTDHAKTQPAAAAKEQSGTERKDARGGESCVHSWFRQEPLTPATYKCAHCGAMLR